MKNLRYFHSSFIVTGIGLVIGGIVGYIYSQTIEGALTAAFLTLILSVLEISLSFDNAVVNASVLRQMTPRWRQRFLTWGMLIAVFGMRLVFPLAIVSIVGKLDPWQALLLAATRPGDYAHMMLGAHVTLAGFGGSFLLMVCLAYFFNHAKETHWLEWLERPLANLGKITAIEACICLVVNYSVSTFLPEVHEQLAFLTAAIFGVATFIAVDGIGAYLQVPQAQMRNVEKASAAMFMYLEILDSSFSFDGVIGAFALTHNLFIIAAGLGVGAMFVRSMTIYLVEKGTLDEYRYLEHGAFYAIGALAVVMLVDVFTPVPEVVTGLLGALIIGGSIFSSVRYRRNSKKRVA